MTPTLEPEIALQHLRAARQAMAARVDEIRAEIAGKGLLGRFLARRQHAAALGMMTRLIASSDERIDALEFGIEVQRAQVARQERAVREAAR